MPPSITPAILDTVLGHLAKLFLTTTGGDVPAARNAADSVLAAYDLQTDDELRLGADIVSFGLHSLEALGQAMAVDLPLGAVLRLRGCAVNLNRAAHRSQRKLDQLQRARRLGDLTNTDAVAPSPTEPAAVTDQPKIDQALGLIEFAREALEAGTKTGVQSWSLSHQKRRAAHHIAETFKRKQAEHVKREERARMAAATRIGVVADIATASLMQPAPA